MYLPFLFYFCILYGTVQCTQHLPILFISVFCGAVSPLLFYLCILCTIEYISVSCPFYVFYSTVKYIAFSCAIRTALEYFYFSCLIYVFLWYCWLHLIILFYLCILWFCIIHSVLSKPCIEWSCTILFFSYSIV